MSSLYDVLNVERGADANTIRKAYMKLAREHHPDKGGDAELFKKIQKAYEVLSDDQRREMYDATGHDGEGAPEGGGGGGGPFGGGMPFPFDLGAMFGGMFGGMGGMGGGPGRRGPQRKGMKAPPKIHEMPISLWDFYHGKTIKIQFERQKFCETCKGEGAEEFETCGGCQGSGMMRRMVMMGPGMQGIMQGPCDACRGEGKKVKKTCSTCKGKQFITQEKNLDVVIEPGMRPGETIIFSRECSDQHDYMEAGDVHIVLHQADEDGAFKRGGGGRDDLMTERTITLKSALVGSSERLEGHPGHPQGLVVEIPAGVQNGEVLVIPGEGMPIRQGGGRGALHVRVRVTVTEAEKEVLKAKGEEIRSLFT